MAIVLTAHHTSPLGEMILGSCGNELCLCDWVGNKRRDSTVRRLSRILHAGFEHGTSAVIQNAITQLNEYFDGKRTRFTIPVRFAGSDFQCRVWLELMNVAYGETLSYAEVARRINNPKAVRAVAAANAMNPISIFVPCHRIIGSNNKLTGYAGGLPAKQGLLNLEARVLKTGLF